MRYGGGSGQATDRQMKGSQACTASSPLQFLMSYARNWNRRARDSRQICGSCTPTSALRAERIPDRKSTRLNSSHANISYAVFCLKKKNRTTHNVEQHNSVSPTHTFGCAS